MTKETSSRVSTIAARIMQTMPWTKETVPSKYANALLADAKTLAGSCLSQDETPGQHGKSEIVAELTDTQIALDPILHFFHYSHLPPKLQATSRTFFILAAHIVNTLPRNPERTVALRKLLEAKDAAVRANLPLPGRGTSAVASTKPSIADMEKHLERHGQGSIDIHPNGEVEMRETGGHDIDRDGPIPFGGVDSHLQTR